MVMLSERKLGTKEYIQYSFHLYEQVKARLWSGCVCVWQGLTGKRHEGTFWKGSLGMWVTLAPAPVSSMNRTLNIGGFRHM